MFTEKVATIHVDVNAYIDPSLYISTEQRTNLLHRMPT
jgi:hypothetical protein